MEALCLLFVFLCLSLSILILFILLALYTPNSCDFLFSQHEKEKAPFFFVC